jgi:hypothetical protein
MVLTKERAQVLAALIGAAGTVWAVKAQAKSLGGAAPAGRGWYNLAQMSSRMAHRLGVISIRAEQRYYEAVEKSRG